MKVRLVALLAAAALSARAAAPENGPSSPDAPHLNITPTENGVLLDSQTFHLYLRGQVALEECNLRLASRDKLISQAADQVQRSWWERNSFWIGTAFGAALMLGLTWGTVKVLTSSRSSP